MVALVPQTWCLLIIQCATNCSANGLAITCNNLTVRVLNMEGKANESAPFMESESQLTSVNKACGNGSLQWGSATLRQMQWSHEMDHSMLQCYLPTSILVQTYRLSWATFALSVRSEYRSRKWHERVDRWKCVQWISVGQTQLMANLGYPAQ